jgi:NADPH:quinone reductase-like Zn-dependent oxidoreductase
VKAYFLESRDQETRLELRDVPQPQPKDGQVLVKVRAAGLNRGEFIAGHGLTPPGAAKAAGQEAAGEIVGTGEGVMGRAAGAFAEYVVMDRREALPIPAGLSFEQAASIPLTFTVVHDMLIAQGGAEGGLRAGEWLLITGVTSGVGVAALQAAKALGAKVIGTSGSEDKLARLRPLGLDVALRTRGADASLAQKALEATGGQGVSLIVNSVGGSVVPECIKALAFQGRMAIVGYVDGVLRAEVDFDAVHAKRLRIFGVSNKLRNADQRAETVRGFTADFLPLFAAGKIAPLVDKVFAFGELQAAKAYMESDAHVGKIVVRL